MMSAITGAFSSIAKHALVATAGALAFGAVAMAQTTPAPAPAPPKHVKPPRKKEPEAPPPAPQQPTQQVPQPAPAAPQPPQQAAAAPPVIFSPWTKICPKNPANPQAKQVCMILKEVRLETGQFLAGAALIEQEGEQKKLLRITLPLGMQLPQGTRLVLDNEQPASAGFVTCVPNGCMADYEINPEFIAKMKKGQQILLQGINLGGQVVSYPLPLTEFGKAVDGPPTDPEVFAAAQKKEWEERLRQQQQKQAAPAK